MSRTELKKIKKNDIFLYSTGVENLFINELLPAAPAEYVKVYLFCLMLAEYEQPAEPAIVSNVLGITEDDYDRAWSYWEDKGAVERIYDPKTGNYQITFQSLLEGLYGQAPEEKPSDSGIDAGAVSSGAADQADAEEEERIAIREMELRGLFTAYEESAGRPISRKESDKIRNAVNVYNVTPDVFSYAIQYCAELQKNSIDYIFTVALRWTEDGCRDTAQVKERLEEERKRNLAYTSIFREMGFTRLPSPADREMMSVWLDDWGFKLNEVLEACRMTAGLREPTLRYVQRVLENKRKEAGGIRQEYARGAERETKESASVSKRVLGDYYEYLRNSAELTYQEHLEEARAKIPGMSDILALENEWSKAILSYDFGTKAREDRKTKLLRRKELEEQKRKLLREAGYPEDFLEKKFRCEFCRDTGLTDEGNYCSCVKERAKEAYIWNKRRTK